MRLLIVRHAPAGDRKRFAKTGRPDRLRPLTEKGRWKMRKAARGIKKLIVKVDLLAYSPLVRAKQTAEILQKAFGKVSMAEIPELAPSAEPRLLLKWLKGRREKTVALVGHEPHLGRFIALACAGRTEPLTELKKGQACLLDWDPEKKGAKILWSARPSQLRRLGR